ncbi:glycosyltransferase [Hymenobacter jejuensis]|uniref:Glycosyltransferase n=2 Tax=Hymenobacter jejuensis TaxID=2502781 RepID=A0A5B8A627_9BACT|nr:glycosyltransferase [Hymenobacter jejuensis]
MAKPLASVPQIQSRNASGLRVMHFLVVTGMLLLINFLWWFCDKQHIGYAPLFWLLTLSMGFKLLRMVHEWVHYCGVSEPVRPDAAPVVVKQHRFTVDVLTTACPGEPLAMFEKTLRAMQAITYPHTSYLCDEGDDPVLRRLCAELGVVHVTRQVKVDAKAGNINNALRQATGELCVVLDPDHVPTPDFLDRVVPYFIDPKVGFTQVVQAYGNQADSLIAQGAAEQTYHFYGPLMMGMNRFGTALAIGANCTFRRTALDSIGGHAPGLTEDMHTAMRLHAHGWQSVYVPEVLSRGLVPSSLASFYAQQLKWSRGAFDLLFRVYPRLFSRLTWSQKLHYATLPLYFLAGVITLIDLVVPGIALLIGRFPWSIEMTGFAAHFLPLVAIALVIRLYSQRWLRDPREVGLHLVGGFLRAGTWWVYTVGFVYAILGIKVPYIPTPKESALPNEWRVSAPNIAAGLLNLLVVLTLTHEDRHNVYSLAMTAFCLFNAASIFASVGLGLHRVHLSLARLATRVSELQIAGRVLGLLQAANDGAKALLRRPAVAATSAVMIMGLMLTGTLALHWHANQYVESPTNWALDGGPTLHTGIALNLKAHSAAWQPVTTRPDVVALAISVSPSPDSVTSFPTDWVRSQLTNEQVPLLTFSLGTATAPITPGSVALGQLDAYWDHCLQALQSLQRPVLIRLAWDPALRTQSPAITSAASIKAWRHVVERCRRGKDSNILWVWDAPAQPDSMRFYYPGERYVDWVSIDCSKPFRNERPASDSLAALQTRYEQFRASIAQCEDLHGKPVLVVGPAIRPDRLGQQTQTLGKSYPEIKAAIFGTTPIFEPVLATSINN